MSDNQAFPWGVTEDTAEEQTDEQILAELEREEQDAADADNTDTDEDEIERFDIDAQAEPAVDAVLAALRKQLLDNAKDDKVRKAVPILAADRKKIRRRSVDTDVSVSDLTFDAVMELAKSGADVDVATSRAAKKREDRITLTAPSYWWSLVALAAAANEGQQADVIATAINKHLG